MHWLGIGLGVLLAGAQAVCAQDGPGPDSVKVSGGDHVSGRVVSLGADGFLRMRLPCMDQDAALRSTAIREVSFAPTVGEADPHGVLLTNGDWIAGTVSAMTAAQVDIKSSAAGTLTIDRTFVQSIFFRPSTRVTPPVADFTSGNIEPFRRVPGRANALALAYKQNKPITVEMEWLPTSANAPGCNFGFFVADPCNPRSGSFTVQLWDGRIVAHGTVVGKIGSSSAYIHELPPNEQPLRQLRITVDPFRQRIRMLFDGKPVRDLDMGMGPTEGDHIVIEYLGVMPLRSFRVLEDAKSDPTPMDDAARDVVLLMNNDRMTAESVSVSEGKLTAASEMGRMCVALEDVGVVTLRTAARKLPAVDPKAVRVKTSLSTLTLCSVELNEHALTGRAEFVRGTVRMERAAVKGMVFGPPEPAVAPAETDGR